MAGLIFEWDEDKARHNLDKHGVAFVGALAVFEDPRRIERLDLRWDYGEERVQIIGRSKGRLSLGDRRWFHLRQVNRLLTTWNKPPDKTTSAALRCSQTRFGARSNKTVPSTWA